MTATYSPALATAIAAAADDTARANALATALGNTRTVHIFYDPAGGADPYTSGLEVYSIGAAGAMTIAGGKITGHGTLSGTTVRANADLSTGSACVRIEGNGAWAQFSIGLSGAKDLIASSSLVTNGGITLKNLALRIGSPNSGGSGGGGGTPYPGTMATMKVWNEDVASAPSGFIAPMTGHPFKKGHIPAGYYPEFKTPGGVTCPYTMFNKTTWSDGSLKFASFLIRVPAAVAAGASVDITIAATSTAPGSTSARTLADLSSGSADLNVAVIGADQLTGTWVSSLNQGVTDNDDVIVLGDGPVGKVWRVRQQFMQGGANHGQLEAYWYVAALQDEAGGLYGIRHLARISQPWYNVDTPAKSYRSFSSMKLNNGATLIRECVNKHAVAATLPGAGAYLNATSHGLTNLRMVRFTATTFPTGLAANTSYIVDNATTNSFSLRDVTSFGDVNMSGTASGDLTIQALVYIPQFSSVFTAGASGKWDFTKAGGSAASDPATRIAHDSAYWMTTGVVPRYENLTVAAQTAYPYEPNYMGPAVSAINTSGERPDIGVMPTWHVKHLLSQSAAAEQTARSTGLAAANLPNQYLNSTTRSFIPVNGASYAGMPTSNTDFRAHPDYNSGFTPPASGPKIVGQDHNDSSHRPALAYYPYVLTGEPQMLDIMLEIAWYTAATEYSPLTTQTSVGLAGRNVKIGANTYSGIVSMFESQRQSAWAIRDMAVAAGLCPDVAPQCASYKQYFKDTSAANFAAVMDYLTNMAPTYQKTTGMLSFDTTFPFADPWMHGYEQMSVAMAYALTEDANSKSFMNHLAKWPAYIYTNFGLHYLPAFEIMVRTGTGASAPLITSDSQMTFFGRDASWSSSTNVLTMAAKSTSGYAPANGDVIMWDGQGYNGGKPANLSLATPYYIVNASGNTFQLAATPGGAPLALGNSSSGGFFYRATTTPTGTIEDGSPLSTSGYTANILGALKLSKAAGATVSQALIDAMETKVAGLDFASEPKYRFADHF